jgi:hypothetical protein
MHWKDYHAVRWLPIKRNAATTTIPIAQRHAQWDHEICGEVQLNFINRIAN